MRCVCPCACLCDCTFVMVWFLSMIICEYMWLGCLSVTMCSFLWLCVWLYMCDCGYQTVWLYDYVRPWVRFGYITLWFTWVFSGCVQFYVSESPSRWDCVGVWLYAWLCVTVCDHVCVCDYVCTCNRLSRPPAEAVESCVTSTLLFSFYFNCYLKNFHSEEANCPFHYDIF